MGLFKSLFLSISYDLMFSCVYFIVINVLYFKLIFDVYCRAHSESSLFYSIL